MESVWVEPDLMFGLLLFLAAFAAGWELTQIKRPKRRQQ